ncbi:MAG TPA: ABC transporter ATP-binding protein [Ignavibacteriaceae bacterium]|nr:ABC transporter ATP-binding protein [Ignavibacteriaceae bacterium]
MRTEISKLHQRLEATMIYVTHDQTEAMTMGDKIVIMKDGVVNQTDSPLNLYNYPNNKFVAGFIGSPSMNFVEGKISEEGNILFKSKGGNVNVTLSNNYSNKLKPLINKSVWMGIRPEDIYDSASSSSIKNPAKINVKLEVVEPMGNEIFLYFPVDGEQFVSRIPARVEPEAGSMKELYLDTDKLHFFDMESENTVN